MAEGSSIRVFPTETTSVLGRVTMMILAHDWTAADDSYRRRADGASKKGNQLVKMKAVLDE